MVSRRAFLTLSGALFLMKPVGARAVIPIADMHSHHAVYSKSPIRDALLAGDVALAALAIVPDRFYLARLPSGETKQSKPIAPGDLLAAYQRMSNRVGKKILSEGLILVKSRSDLNRVRVGSPGIVFSVEGADFLEGDLNRLTEAHRIGIRQVGIAHFIESDLVDIRTERPRHSGLTVSGRHFIEKANELGIVVDLAHATDEAIEQACAMSKKPLLYSHGSIGRFKSDYRSRAGDIMAISRSTARKLADGGGVIGIWASRANFDSIADYGDAVIKFIDWIGSDHVAFGTDMAGLGQFELLQGGYSELRKVVEHMQKQGLPTGILEKVAFTNYRRVLESVFTE